MIHGTFQPAIPRVLPASREKLTPSTARTTPPRVWKWVRRSETSSSGIGREETLRSAGAQKKTG